MSYVAVGLGEWATQHKDLRRAYKKTLTQTGSHFITEIIDSSAAFGIRGCALFLKVLGVAIEYLEIWSAG